MCVCISNNDTVMYKGASCFTPVVDSARGPVCI